MQFTYTLPYTRRVVEVSAVDGHDSRSSISFGPGESSSSSILTLKATRFEDEDDDDDEDERPQSAGPHDPGSYPRLTRGDGVPRIGGTTRAGGKGVALHKMLEQIVAHKRAEVAAAKAARPQAAVEARAAAAPPPRDFVGALRRPGVSLIAEVKRRSPSAGLIRAAFHPTRIARIYESHGASAISVLTDERFFGGSLAILRRVRRAVGIPVLRKDFVVDRYQLYEARAAGADAVLLITEILRPKELAALLGEARGLGLACLVEAHCLAALNKALKAGAEIVGINNRDLHTFKTDLATTQRLAARVPRGKVIVSESAIRTRADVEQVAAWGADAVLVGEALMRQHRIGRAVDELLGKG